MKRNGRQTPAKFLSHLIFVSAGMRFPAGIRTENEWGIAHSCPPLRFSLLFWNLSVFLESEHIIRIHSVSDSSSSFFLLPSNINMPIIKFSRFPSFNLQPPSQAGSDPSAAWAPKDLHVAGKNQAAPAARANRNYHGLVRLDKNAK